MTKEDFQKLWILNYPDTKPISHLFKNDYSERWFRIHSLPESKRYAENEDDWEILLGRQNEIINHLLGDETPIFLVTGDYVWEDWSELHITEEEVIFSSFEFTKLDIIKLHEIHPEQYDESDIYRPAFTQIVWKLNSYNNILREIASDNIRAFFVSFDKNVIVAPYDGGIDFVLKDSLTKEYNRNQYRKWLSEREDGL